METLSNTEAWLKKNVAYKKKSVIEARYFMTLCGNIRSLEYYLILQWL